MTQYTSTTLVMCVHELFGEDHAYWVDTQLTCRVWDKTDLAQGSNDHPMLEIAVNCVLVHVGMTPYTSTTLVMCVPELFVEEHAYWVDTQLTCRVWAKTDLPWASDDHPMLEIAHDLHIGAPWNDTNFYYTSDVYMNCFWEDHAYQVDTQLTSRVWAKTDIPWASDDHPMLEITHDLRIGARWNDTHFYYTCDLCT